MIGEVLYIYGIIYLFQKIKGALDSTPPKPLPFDFTQLDLNKIDPMDPDVQSLMSDPEVMKMADDMIDRKWSVWKLFFTFDIMGPILNFIWLIWMAHYDESGFGKMLLGFTCYFLFSVFIFEPNYNTVRFYKFIQAVLALGMLVQHFKPLILN